MVCYGLNADAQVDESRNFVYFYSDSVLYVKHVRLRTDIFNSLKLNADSKRLSLEQVKFFNSDGGFFANTKELNAIRTVELAERVVEGKINLFQERSYRKFSSNWGHVYPDRNRDRVDIRMYYNKGYDDLKKVNYRNLKTDMADDANSLDLLEGYRKSTNTSKALYVAAGASIAAAVITFLVKSNDKGSLSRDHHFDQFPDVKRKSANFTSGFLLLGGGVGFAIGGYAVNVAGLKKLEAAVDTYNR